MHTGCHHIRVGASPQEAQYITHIHIYIYNVVHCCGFNYHKAPCFDKNLQPSNESLSPLMLCNDCGQVMQQVFPRSADPTSSDAFDLLLSGAAGCPSTSPIFVVGMPRSGSTLVEHILSSHPQAHGAGINTGYCAYLVKPHPPPPPPPPILCPCLLFNMRPQMNAAPRQDT